MCSAFARDRQGAVATFVAGGIVAMVGVVGLATDAARGYMVKARLGQALDAAALAGGRDIFSESRDADIQMFFNANFPPGFMGASVTGPTILVSDNHEKLTLTAGARLDTTFMKVLGIQDLNVTSSTEVTRETTYLDVVLAIDMSGSMTSWSAGQTRISAARNAAKQLINILYGTDETKDLLKIGVVPWNGKVNVMRNGVPYDHAGTVGSVVGAFTNPLTGSLQSQVYFPNNSPVPLLSAPPADWKGCVFSRYIHNASAGDDADILFGAHSSASGDWNAWEPAGPEAEPVAPGVCLMSMNGSECTPCLDHGITPLQNSKSGAVAAIDELISPEGTTNITQGLAWAWRVVKPEAPFTEADPDPDGPRQQAIVLLTDGENFAGNGDGYKAAFGYGSGARDAMNDRLRELAANIKGSGVKIYTIQFANSGGPLQSLMKQVASGPDAPYYHYAPDSTTLQTVFQQVANHLSELRLSR
ncbi:MAG: VWA domain-containing protein [Rhodospirillaceae bacterium]